MRNSQRQVLFSLLFLYEVFVIGCVSLQTDRLQTLLHSNLHINVGQSGSYQGTIHSFLYVYYRGR